MTTLNAYLTRHYLTAPQLAQRCRLDPGALDALLAAGLLPAPAYVVDPAGTLRSFVFGALAAADAAPGRYFHPAQQHWVAVALQAIARHGRDGAGAALQRDFTTAYGAALATLHDALWPLPDRVDRSGGTLADGLRQRTDSAWTHFQQGTFQVCVAEPLSAPAIARKEVLQHKLAQLTDGGVRTGFSLAERAPLLALMDALAAASMPFSPADYPLSSRKRLIDDLRPRLSFA
jgi:hypothetical protein